MWTARSTPRIEAILSAIQPCRSLADVGTDHGLVPVLAVIRDIAQRAIAADIRAAPLEVARRQIARAGLADRVTAVQGDGLVALGGEAVDAVVLAGLSGTLMRRICDEAPEQLASVQQLVVQPNSDADLMRGWAREHGWHLRDERMLQTRGRFFVVCAFVRRSGADPAYELEGWGTASLLRIGPLLARRNDPVARLYCQAQRGRLQALVASGVTLHAPELATFQAACSRLGAI